jgi:hypothetical protein
MGGGFRFSSPIGLIKKEVTSMKNPWEKPFEDREEMKKTLSPMGMMGHVTLFLGIIFAVLGVIAGAANMALGLGSTSWLLLAIFVCVVGMPGWLTWAIAMHLLGMEARTQKKE